MDRIMIIDSSERYVSLMENYLTQAGYTVYSANTGAGALAKANMFPPDLILIDTELSDMSGYDVCKMIKKSKNLGLVLVIFLINIDSEEHSTKALRAGADDVLYKYQDMGIFVAKLKSILRIKHLSNELQKQYAELEEKNRILDYELKMAMNVQRSLIIEIDEYINGIHFVSKYMPAMDIGGDFYDIVRLDDHRVAVMMGDVSGHGISAALITSMLNHMFKTFVHTYPLPNELLAVMNREFCNIFKKTLTEIYACIFYAVVNTKTKTITYSNAGHALPYFVLAKENTVLELSSSGVPIGMLDDSHYDNMILDCYPGDILFLQTDGLGDVFYKDKPDVYSQKMRELLLEFKENPPSETIESVLSTFYKWELTDNEKYSIDDVSIIMCVL